MKEGDKKNNKEKLKEILEERKESIIREYYKNRSKISEISKDENKKNTYLKELIKSLEILLEKYFIIKKKHNIGLESVPVLYGIISICLEGVVKIYLFDKKPLELIESLENKETLGKLKDKIKKLVKNEDTKEYLDYLNFLRNHYVHFPMYFTSYEDDEYKFLYVIHTLLKEINLYSDLSNEVKIYIEEVLRKHEQR